MSLDALRRAGAYGPGAQITAAGSPTDARVATGATSVTDTVEVLTPGASQRTGPCSFMARVNDAGGVVLPAPGDRCAWEQTRDGRFVLVWWEPA